MGSGSRAGARSTRPIPSRTDSSLRDSVLRAASATAVVEVRSVIHFPSAMFRLLEVGTRQRTEVFDYLSTALEHDLALWLIILIRIDDGFIVQDSQPANSSQIT